MRKCIAVDLDGTLAFYNGWKGENFIGDPIPLMLGRVKDWIKEGHEVIIFTARADNQKSVEYVKLWLGNHGLPGLIVTNTKLKRIGEFWDDRAVRVIANKGVVSNQKDFK